MRVSARMVSPSGQFRAPEWTLRSKFKEALKIFKLGGIEVRAFEAEWGYMSRGEISGNLDAFFGHLREHKGTSSLVDAARVTPSGKVAAENGFTKVSVLDVGYDPNQEHLQATEKRARQVRPVVRVRFAQPGTTFPDEVLSIDVPDKPGSPPPPKGSVFETQQPSPFPPQQTLPTGSIFETDPVPIKTPPGKPDIETPSLIVEVKSPPGKIPASI